MLNILLASIKPAIENRNITKGMAANKIVKSVGKFGNMLMFAGIFCKQEMKRASLKTITSREKLAVHFETSKLGKESQQFNF